MIKLYYAPSNASMAPHMLLREFGVPFELVAVDREKGGLDDPAYRKLNPHGRIPTLVDGDLVLFETAAICLYLCDRFDEKRLAPPLGSAERAHFYKWLVYLTNTIQADVIVYFYPHRWSSSAAGEKEVKACAEQRLNGMFDLVELELARNAQEGKGPYLLGANYSAVDPYLFMLARWTRNMQRPAKTLPHLQEYLAMLLQRPAVRSALQAEGLAEPYY